MALQSATCPLTSIGARGRWLTSDGDTVCGHGLEGRCTDKARYRLMVDVPEDDPVLVKWTEWGAKNATPATIRGQHATASNFDTWYVYLGACVDMSTGIAVEDWRDRPEGDVRPVPPERRHAWHKGLMKKFRRLATAPAHEKLEAQLSPSDWRQGCDIRAETPMNSAIGVGLSRRRSRVRAPSLPPVFSTC